MSGKTNLTFTNFSAKKLLSKAHTSMGATDNEEIIGSAVQISAQTIFANSVPSAPNLTLNSVQSNAVEYVDFDLIPINASFFDSNDFDTDASAQAAGHHAYAFKLKNSYETDTDNTNAGNGSFVNGKHLTGSLGALQIVNPSFSLQSPNPYMCTIYSGSRDVQDQIPLTDELDWYVDYYNGILYVQDFDSTKVPTRARGFIYVGDMVSTQLGGGGGGSGTGVGFIASGNGGISTTGSLFVGTNTAIASNSDIFFGNTGEARFNAQSLNSDFTVNSQNRTGIKIDADLNKALFLSGGSALSNDEASAADVSFYVSGTIDSTGGSTGGVSLFGGDVVTSGSFTSKQGISGSLTRLADGSSYIVAGANVTVVSQSNGSITISSSGGGGGISFTGGSGNNNQMITADGAGNIVAETNISFNGSQLEVTGTILPGLDKTYDLGGPNNRFANIYTGDLHLRNERGHWQIVEEADALTVINRLTGKRYKMVLEPYPED